MIKFKNGVSFETRGVFQGSGRYQGIMRDILEIRVNSNVISFDELKKLYMDEDALSEITVTTQDGEELVYTDYVIRAEIKSQSTSDENVDCLTMKVGQMTQVETQTKQNAADILLTQNALLEIADTIGGE